MFAIASSLATSFLSLFSQFITTVVRLLTRLVAVVAFGKAPAQKSLHLSLIIHRAVSLVELEPFDFFFFLIKTASLAVLE